MTAPLSTAFTMSYTVKAAMDAVVSASISTPVGPVVLALATMRKAFRSVHRRATDTTHTVISNTTEGAWPITTLVEDHLRARP